MKKLIPLFFAILFSLAIYSQVIEKTYTFDIPKISGESGFQILNFENTLNCGISGEPSLPYQDVKLLLPPGERAVSIEFAGEDEVTIDGNFQIYPQQSSKPLSEPGIFQLAKNELIYSTNAFYPSEQTGELLTQYINGYAFAISSFTPVKYNPVTGEVRFFRKVRIRIVTEPCKQSDESLQNIKNDKNTSDRIKQFSQDSEILKEYPAIKETTDDYEMLIITPEIFIETFYDLTDFYLLRGFKSVITSIEDIDAVMHGSDLQEKIRNYIIEEYQNRNIRFVLLGGDTEFVPARGFYAYVNSGDGYEDNSIPADLYYSALDGNWNNDGDFLWGEEGEEDFLPEIAVGRFPFSNQEELDNMIHKTISYQNNPVPGEFNNALFAGESLWDDPFTTGSQYLELLVGNQTDNGYETNAIPETYNIERLYDEVGYWDAHNFMDAVNSGKQYVHHVGHADYNYVSFMYNEDITDENFAGANGTDHNYTIFHSHGCVCGAFDYDDCILERMVCINNFAVAVLGNSRYGWFNEGQTEGPAIHLHREMMDALYHDKLYCIGEALMDSKIQTAPWITAPGQWEEGAMKWNFYDLNLLGDPSLSVWTEEPISVIADYNHVLPVNAISTTVNLSVNSFPASGLTCVIIKDGVVHSRGITDISGNVVLDIEPSFTETGNAQLIVSGNNCKPTTFNISVEDFSGIANVKDSELKIYPNPANDFINVFVPADFNSEAIISVFSQNGQKLLEQEIKSDSLRLDISKFSKGYYIITVSNNSKTVSAGFTKTCK